MGSPVPDGFASRWPPLTHLLPAEAWTQDFRHVKHPNGDVALLKPGPLMHSVAIAVISLIFLLALSLLVYAHLLPWWFAALGAAALLLVVGVLALFELREQKRGHYLTFAAETATLSLPRHAKTFTRSSLAAFELLTGSTNTSGRTRFQLCLLVDEGGPTLARYNVLQATASNVLPGIAERLGEDLRLPVLQINLLRSR